MYANRNPNITGAARTEERTTLAQHNSTKYVGGERLKVRRAAGRYYVRVYPSPRAGAGSEPRIGARAAGWTVIVRES